MNEDPTPIQLELDEAGDLIIQWSDQKVQKFSIRFLRDHCPCATCLEKKISDKKSESLFPIISPEQTQPLQIKSMEPAGNYAYRIEFSDSHSAGVYTLEYLRSLSG